MISDLLVLWRSRTPLAFMFVIPAVLSIAVGPAIGGGGNDDGGRALLGLAVLFSFMTVNYFGLALFREYGENTWIRQSMMRPSKVAFFAGKAVPVIGLGTLQLGTFAAIAFAIYRVPLHGNALQLLVTAVSLAFAGCAIGGLLFTITRQTPVFQSLAYIVLLASGSFGGAIVRTESLPVYSQQIGYFTPQYWALSALVESTSGGGSWLPVTQAALVINSASVALFLVTVALFNFADEKTDLS
jgi:ABC-2 type transport system permease protein